MNVSLDFYSTYGSSGKIYVKCIGDGAYKVDYHLYDNDILIKSKCAYGNELVAFSYACPSIYRIRAAVCFQNGEKRDVYTDDIIPVLYDKLPPPVIEIKSLKTPLALVPDQENYLIVKFYKGGLEKLNNESSSVAPIYSQIRHAISFVPCFDHDRIDTVVKYSPEMESLKYKYRVKPNIGSQLLLELGNELQPLDYVEYCDLGGKFDVQPCHHSSPAEALSPVPANTPTPDFSYLQTYIDGEFGLNVRKVWDRGITGKDIQVVMYDTGIFPQHEDLEEIVEALLPYYPDPDHGTACAGIIMARNNGFGMTGIAFDANLRAYGNMSSAVASAQPGDVVTMSMGTFYGAPLISEKQFWDEINQLVNSNVLVVIAAGNLGLDLDSYRGFVDHGDSGVIIAGACDPQTGRRLRLSNYNVRNIVNAWGESVATCGYGDLFNPDSVDRQYTGIFGGTSAATPMIAGVLALIQSYARERYHTIFNNRQILEIIENTGYSEGIEDQIGVRPNALRAIEYVDVLLGEEIEPPLLYPAWQLGTQYEKGDRVSHLGLYYECLQAHKAISPTWAPSIAASLWGKLEF